MNIQRQSKTTLDTDLLERLAFKQASGGTISATEAKAEVNRVKRELKSNFRYNSSKSTLARAETAVSNTFALAIKSGWVKGTTAKSAINEFVKGKDAASLRGTLDAIRSEAKTTPPPRRGYGSSSTRSYGS